jgi:hypothetical protein
VPGGDACAARLVGAEVDTMLMLNRDGKLLLVAGRNDWNVSGPEDIGLRIDDLDAMYLQASELSNLVLVPISNEIVLKRL